jgi:16S rRNA (cytosine1402-N4)-methyltransferase
LGDLGVSSHQFDEAERGFSIRFDAALDMRMNKNNSLTAQIVVNEYEEQELISIFRTYAELPNSTRIAKAIVESRSVKKIESTSDLKNVIETCVPKFEQNKFYARIFQALRIVVNDEISALEDALKQSAEILKPKGRLVIISYHSLEDRLVKNLIKSGNTKGLEETDIIYGIKKKFFKNLTTKPIIPSEEEINFNTRARSAKLRVAEKL